MEKADEIYDDCYKPDVEIDELSDKEAVQDDASSTIEVLSIYSISVEPFFQADGAGLRNQILITTLGIVIVFAALLTLLVYYWYEMAIDSSDTPATHLMTSLIQNMKGAA